MKRIMAGYDEYLGYDIIKDDKTRTRRSGPIVEWRVAQGLSFVGKFPTKTLAKEYIDGVTA